MESQEIFIGRKIMGLGASPQYLGYYYLIRAIHLALNDIMLLHGITTCIYPEIAKMYNTTPQGVERCIRTLINNIWNYGNKRLLKSLFGEHQLTRPSNAHFISVVTVGLFFESNVNV